MEIDASKEPIQIRIFMRVMEKVRQLRGTRMAVGNGS